MSDLRFDEVVTDDRSFRLNDKQAHKALCSTCGEWSEVTIEEFRWPFSTEQEDLRYVAQMRAWNCCHQTDDPLDGFPEKPDSSLTAAEE